MPRTTIAETALRITTQMAKVSHIVLPVSDVQKSCEWYVNKLGFTFEREREEAVGIKDQSGLTIFLMKAAGPLAGQKITLTIQVGNVDSMHQELAALGVNFVNPPKRQFWGYGAEVLDPDGYINHLWDEVTMGKAMRDMREGSAPVAVSSVP
jgi:catechol 2,3-dioxygenase-like lactoylglutathione lyase family enzyme